MSILIKEFAPFGNSLREALCPLNHTHRHWHIVLLLSVMLSSPLMASERNFHSAFPFTTVHSEYFINYTVRVYCRLVARSWPILYFGFFIQHLGFSFLKQHRVRVPSCSVMPAVYLLIINKLINSNCVAWLPGKGNEETFSFLKPGKFANKRKTAHDSATSKPRYQKKIQIFVNFMLKFY